MSSAGRSRKLSGGVSDLLSRVWSSAPPWLRSGLCELPLVVVFTVFVVSGLRGVDLGYHWDEAGWHVKPSRDMLESRLFLPRAYVYPTLTKWLIVLPSVPAGIDAAITGHGDAQRVLAAMVATMDAPGYLLRARRVFIVVSALSILWLYGAARSLRYSRPLALVAAASVGLSWDFACHARWVVPDCIVVQFSALTLFMLARFQRTGKAGWLYAAAGAVGLATGSKYPGIFVLFSVVLTGAFALPFRPLLPQARRAASVCAVALAVYLATTPGTLLDPFKFFGDTSWIAGYYANNPHAGHTATSAWDHGRIALTYFSLSYFSPHWAVSGVLFAGVLFGVFAWVRRDRRFGIALFAFPFAFLLVFCFRYRIAIARNYLFMTPFLAIFLARGVAELSWRLPRAWARWLLAGALTIVFATHAIYLVRAGESIRHLDPNAYVKQAIAYVSNHPRDRFRLSPQVRMRARAQRLTIPANVADQGAAGHVVFFGNAEGPGSWNWKANDPFLTEAVFGPREINFNWIPGWLGHDRVVVMTTEKARGTGVPCSR